MYARIYLSTDDRPKERAFSQAPHQTIYPHYEVICQKGSHNSNGVVSTSVVLLFDLEESFSSGWNARGALEAGGPGLQGAYPSKAWNGLTRNW